MSDKLELIRKRLDARAKQATTEPLFEMTNNDERDRVWRAIEANGVRIDNLQDTIQETIMQAVRDGMPRALLSDEEHRYVQAAIKKQAQSIAFRQKIIDNTMTGLVWALVLALGVMIKEYLVAHGWKL